MTLAPVTVCLLAAALCCSIGGVLIAAVALCAISALFELFLGAVA